MRVLPEQTSFNPRPHFHDLSPDIVDQGDEDWSGFENQAATIQGWTLHAVLVGGHARDNGAVGQGGQRAENWSRLC